MNIHISIDAPDAETAREEMRKLLGAETTVITRQWLSPKEERDSPSDTVQYTKTSEPEAEQEAPTRERGQPSPGKSRRTKAEIAEDEAADKADAEQAAAEADVDLPHTDDVAGISTGEERVGPEDDAETVEQDAADEKAETEAARDPEKPLTLDDVRGAFGAYVKAYGIDATQEDVPAVLKEVCGENCVKMSDIPDDQAKLKGVVEGVMKLLRENPHKREAA